jgi:hypothetical protein
MINGIIKRSATRMPDSHYMFSIIFVTVTNISIFVTVTDMSIFVAVTKISIFVHKHI